MRNSQEVRFLLDFQVACNQENDATPKLSPESPEEDMAVEDDPVTEQKEQPKRHTSRPQLYQSDEVEKEKRKMTQP